MRLYRVSTVTGSVFLRRFRLFLEQRAVLAWSNFHSVNYIYHFRILQYCTWFGTNCRASGIIETAESDSTVSLTPLSQTTRNHWHRWVRLSSQQYHRHHWVRLRGIIDTVGVESDSTVSSTPLSQTPQYHWHHWVRLRSIIDTMLRLTPQYHWHHWVRLRSINDIVESYSTVSWTPLSKTPQYHWHHWVWLRSIIDTVESDSAVLIIDTADF